ncbi:MAG: dicarboxylate/amino acid:cation symporter, partial [Cycloclasticus sp.]
MATENKMSLTVKVLLGMGLGIAAGLAINLLELNTAGSFVNVYIIDGLFHVVGKMFVNALKMLVVPLVIFSLICGVCGIGDIRALGRVGGKSFALYMLTTAIAIATAIIIAASSGIGKGMDIPNEANFVGKESPPLSQVLIDIIPSNPINAMANGDMLPVIFFSILLGISMLLVGSKAKRFVEGAEIANEIMMKMVNVVMS